MFLWKYTVSSYCPVIVNLIVSGHISFSSRLNVFLYFSPSQRGPISHRKIIRVQPEFMPGRGKLQETCAQHRCGVF